MIAGVKPARHLSPRGMSAEAKLATFSITEGDCLVWTRYRGKRGYGRIRHAGRMHLVHRLAWVTRHGPIPPETPHVLHHCDNPPCFKDEHLWLGTDADNNADMRAKGRGRAGEWQRARTTCRRNHPYDYTSPSGTRACKECRAEARARHRARTKESA